MQFSRTHDSVDSVLPWTHPEESSQPYSDAEMVLPAPALQIMLLCILQHVKSLPKLHHLELSGISPISELRNYEPWPAPLGFPPVEELGYLLFPYKFLDIQLPELRKLTLSHVCYQQLNTPFLHLETLVIDRGTAFSPSDFMYFCVWLSKLPSLRTLSFCFPKELRMIITGSSTEASRLQLQKLSISGHPSYHPLFHLLHFIDPSILTSNILDLPILNGIPNASELVASEQDVSRLMAMSIHAAHHAPIGVASFVSRSGPSSGRLSITGWEGNPEVKLGCSIASSGASVDSPKPSTSLSLGWAAPDPEVPYASTLRSLTIFAFSTLSIPALTTIYIGCHLNFTQEDWQGFLTRHPNLNVLQVQQRDTHPLFLALLSLENKDNLKSIMLRDCIFLPAEGGGEPSENTWSAMNIYVEAKYLSGNPLRTISFEICPGLGREDMEHLREWVSDFIEFIADWDSLSTQEVEESGSASEETSSSDSEESAERSSGSSDDEEVDSL